MDGKNPAVVWRRLVPNRASRGEASRDCQAGRRKERMKGGGRDKRVADEGRPRGGGGGGQRELSRSLFQRTRDEWAMNKPAEMLPKDNQKGSLVLISLARPVALGVASEETQNFFFQHFLCLSLLFEKVKGTGYILNNSLFTCSSPFTQRLALCNQSWPTSRPPPPQQVDY